MPNVWYLSSSKTFSLCTVLIVLIRQILLKAADVLKLNSYWLKDLGNSQAQFLIVQGFRKPLVISPVFQIRICLIRIWIKHKTSNQKPEPDLVKFIEIIYSFFWEDNHFSSLFFLIKNGTTLYNNTISKKC
jgi:hypothetical protein